MIGASISGDGAVIARFQRGKVEAQAALATVVRKHGNLLVTRIRANASGRPGPNAPTGDYRRSWAMKYTLTPVGPQAVVGTNASQGRRLEFGFTGTDSLGRSFDQPPLPHVEVSIEQTRGPLLQDVRSQVGRVL